MLYYTPPADGSYTIALAVGGENTETFGTMGIAVDGGFAVPAAMMQTTFQHMLDKGKKASALLEDNDLGGAVFLDSPGDWAMQATILQPGETITQRGIVVPAGRASLFMAVAHDMSMNLDIGVEDPDGNMQADTEKDAEPVVLVNARDTDTAYALKVQLAEATEATLATALILRDSK